MSGSVIPGAIPATGVDENGIRGPIGVDAFGNQAIIVSAGALIGASLASVRRLQQTASTASKQQANVAGANSVLPIIYGTRRVGGKTGPWITFGGNLVVRVQWCLGEVDSIVSADVNDNGSLPAGITATHYTGTQTQGVDPTLAAAFAAQGLTYSKTLAGVCYSVFNIQPGANTGVPRFAATIRGLKIRTSQFGARVYSDNPAHAIADFIESTTYGMGQPVDWATVATLASECDALVGGERKRVLNISLDSAQECKAWLDTLRDYASCWAVPEGGVYRLVPDVPFPVGATWGTGVLAPGSWRAGVWSTGVVPLSFSEANIRANTFKMTKRGVRQIPTVVEVTYTDTSVTPWVDRTLPPVYAPGVLDGTTPTRYARIPKPGITRHSEAYRYAIERINAYTLNDLSVSFTSFDEGLKVQVGDICSVSWAAKGLSSKLFRVMKCSNPEPGRWIISADEYDPAKYSSDVVAAPTYPDTTLDDPARPPAPTGLAVVEEVYSVQAGNYASRLRIEWDEPRYSALYGYRIEITQAGARQEVGSTRKGTAEYVTTALKEGLTYVVAVSVVSTTNAESAPATATIATNGKLSRPRDLVTFAGFEVGGDVRLAWSHLDAAGTLLDVDLAGTEVRWLSVADANAAGSTAAAWALAKSAGNVRRFAFPSDHGTIENVGTGHWRFMAVELDSVTSNASFPFGQESVNPITQDIPVTSDAGAFVAANYSFTTPATFHLSQGGASQWVTDFGDTFASLFTSNLATYTNILATYHTAGTSTLITETHDFGLSLTGDWSGSVPHADLSGAASTFIELSAGPDAAKTILGATNATPIVLNITAHGWNTGDEIVVAGVGGNAAANGTRLVTVIDADHVSLQDQFGNNVAGSGAYTSGGTAARWIWAAFVSSTIKTAARYGRLRITTAGTMVVNGLGALRCNVVGRDEGGIATVASSGPTIVTFRNQYNAALSAVVSGRGPTFASGVYDAIEVSGARGPGFGQALRFDGTTGNYVEAPNVAATQLTTLTLECWCKIEQYGSGTYTLVTKRAHVGSAFPYLYQLIILGGHKPRIDIYTDAGAQSCQSLTDCPLNRWFHIAGTVDSTTKQMVCYIDGEIVATLTYSGTFVAPDSTLAIGIVPVSQGVASRIEPHFGLLDEVRIWNYVRTQAQIRAAMSTPATGSESGLVALYHFDALTGTVATDSTSSANHGTVTGAKWRPLDGMDLYLFDAAGTQIAGAAGWQFTGV
jgi:hypothetical protein